MDALVFTVGAVATVYTLVEIAGLLLRADPPGRRRVQRTTEFRHATATSFRGAAFQTAAGGAAGGSFTIDLEPIPGRQANYYG